MLYTQPQSEFVIYKMRRMVNIAGVLCKEQMLRMFRNYGAELVEHHLAVLAAQYEINYDPESGLMTSRIDALRTDESQRMLSSAFWALAEFGDERVDSFWPCNSPSQLIWLENNEARSIHDITVVDPIAVNSICHLWSVTRKNAIPSGAEDICDHIALVYGDYYIDTVMKAGFDRCCVLDKDFHVTFLPPFEWSDQA